MRLLKPLSKRAIQKMLEDKRCPECDEYVEYHNVEMNNWSCPYSGNEDKLIYHFNYDEIMGELR